MKKKFKRGWFQPSCIIYCTVFPFLAHCDMCKGLTQSWFLHAHKTYCPVLDLEYTKVMTFFLILPEILPISIYTRFLAMISLYSKPLWIHTYLFHCSIQNNKSIAQILNTIDLGIFKIIAMASMSLTIQKLDTK